MGGLVARFFCFTAVYLLDAITYWEFGFDLLMFFFFFGALLIQ
jgi:hypothetical protein